MNAGLTEWEAQSVLCGELIELRPLRWEDYASLYAVASDPHIWEQHPANNRHEEPVFRAFFRDAMESGGALVAIDITNGEIIGSSRYHGYSAAESEVEIGWTFLAISYWGGVYNREMKQLMLAHAFRFVERVVFVVGPENRRSQRALERIGGVRTGWRRDASGRESYLYEIRAPLELPDVKRMR